MTDKHLVNLVENCVDESLYGFSKLHPNLFVDLERKIVLDVENAVDGKVALISGGGSGHEPFPAGYVGEGMLTGSISGPIFTSPPSDNIFHGINSLKSSGILFLVPNYTGDALNFGLATESALEKGIVVESVIVGEDVSQEIHGVKKAGKRGMCGLILVIKIAGYLAHTGHSLSEVKKYSEEVVDSIASMGLCVGSCSKPGVGPLFELEKDEMEIGIGVHGEAGIARMKMVTAKEGIEILLKFVVESLKIEPGDEVVALVNNLGGVSCLEQWLLAGELEKQLKEKKIEVSRLYSGFFFTSLNMAGVQICLMKIKPETKELFLKALDFPTTASAWKNQVIQAFDQKKGFSLLQNKIEKKFTNSIRLSSKDSQVLKLCFLKISENLKREERQLNHLDSSCGDGDCGTSFTRLASVIKSTTEKFDFSSPTHLFHELGLAIEKSVGGTTGALYSLFCKGCTKELESIQNFDRNSIPKCWRRGVETIKKYSRARMGDKTMLDALEPGCEEFEKQIKLKPMNLLDCFCSAVNAAVDGCNRTKDSKALAGRASYTDSAQQKCVDAGAYAVTIWLSAIQEVLVTCRDNKGV